MFGTNQMSNNRNNRNYFWVFALIGCSIFLSTGKTDDFAPEFRLSTRLSFGNVVLLPSLEANTGLEYENSHQYSNIYTRYYAAINEYISYSGSLEVTNQPHKLIGTNFSRSDFILSTGRFQESKLNITTKSFSIIAGRADFFSENYRSDVFAKPINGDGFSWLYEHGKWDFKHVLETLPAEKSGDIIFRRLLTYHHLKFHIGMNSFGVAEYFILSGEEIGLDFKRLNPFVPFTLNSHDSYENYYEGYRGDADNSVIKFFFNWSGNKSTAILNFYMDEFHMDSWSRDDFNDALLLNMMYEYRFNSMPMLNLPGTLEATISMANPNFGDHPGPYTSATSGNYSLFESAPGMKSLYFLKTNLECNSTTFLSLSYHYENWVKINNIPPGDRNRKAALERLTGMTDSRATYSLEHHIASMQTDIQISGWLTSNPRAKYGWNVSLTYQAPSFD
jgi:hypothetical protein